MTSLPQDPQHAASYLQPVQSPDVQGAATTSLVLEIIFGLFSLLGIGHVYSGRLGLGIALMLAWWVYLFVAGFISSLTAGLAACLFVPLYFAVPIISGIQASTYVKKSGATGSWSSVALVAGGGCLIILLAIACLVGSLGLLSIGTLGALFQQ